MIGEKGKVTLAASAAALVGVLAVNFAAVVIFQAVTGALGIETGEVNGQLADYGTGINAILVAGFLVPLVEEILFRGIWFRCMRIRFGFAVSAILPSVVFGLTHGSTAFAATFLSAMLLCYLLERTQRLAAPVFVHIANNLLVLMLPVPAAAMRGGTALPAAGLAILAGIFAVYIIKQVTEEFYCQND